MTYQDYLQHIESRCATLGMTKNDFYCTDEYKELYPLMKAAHLSEFGKIKRRKRQKFNPDTWMAALFCGPTTN